ncbi:hypothetical protein [Emticicia sp. C21]|uniref:hypothetical protein n=1 Tax=Emticicia sp. C21 TaxID=2302915 RepID=UPI0011C12FF9|nr:hypothetical protein [Emticicia sp. C21]
MKKTLILSIILVSIFVLYSCRESEINNPVALKQDMSEEKLLQKVRSIDGLDPVEKRKIEEVLIQKIRKSEEFTSLVNFVLKDRISWENVKNKKRVPLFIEGVDFKQIKQQLSTANNYNEAVELYKEIYIESENQIENAKQMISLFQAFVNSQQEVRLLPIQAAQKILDEAVKEEIKSRDLARKSNVHKDCFFDCGANLNLALDKQSAILLVATWSCMLMASPMDIACGIVAYANYSIETHYAFETAEVCFNGC